MEAKELRIGNWVNLEVFPTRAIYTKQFYPELFFDVENDRVKLSPVKLTEEWLIKFKEVEKIVFDSEETGYGVEYHINIDANLRLCIQNDMSFCIEEIRNTDNNLLLDNDYLGTVHYLQNLYNILSKGEELTIKE
jgi:hypothetical protein